MPRRGGGRGRAGFVPSLPPKPGAFQRAHDQLVALVAAALGDLGHVGHGYRPDPAPAGEDPHRYKQPMAEDASKRPGAWTLYVWTDVGEAAAKLPKEVLGVPVAFRRVPKADL